MLKGYNPSVYIDDVKENKFFKAYTPNYYFKTGKIPPKNIKYNIKENNDKKFNYADYITILANKEHRKATLIFSQIDKYMLEVLRDFNINIDLNNPDYIMKIGNEIDKNGIKFYCVSNNSCGEYIIEKDNIIVAKIISEIIYDKDFSSAKFENKLIKYY